jgi:D-glycero-D-manno-heptose 1,7-bisphosphate phosphatase
VTLPLHLPLPLDEEGVWSEVLRPPQPGAAPRPALFLDRDGVIIDEVGYIARAEDVRLIDGAAAVIAAANRCGVAVAVVSNQAGIGRRMFGWTEFMAVQARMLALLAEAGARLDAIYACPHVAAADTPACDQHPARKPNPGMLLRAAAQLNLDLAPSWIIGDRASDMLAGRNAGLEGGVHVATGAGARPDERAAALAVAAMSGFVVKPAASIAVALSLVPVLKSKND